MIPRLKEQYKKTIISDLKKKFSMKNNNQVPKFVKVVLNMGLGLDGTDKKKTSKLRWRYVFDKWTKTSCN